MTKLVERDSWRSIELLVREFPEMTGAEIMERHELDKVEYQNYLNRINGKQMEKVQWLKDNPYLKIVYNTGDRMVFYMEIMNPTFENGEIVFEAMQTTLSMFMGASIKVKEKERWLKWSNFHCGDEVVTSLSKEEYENFHKRIENLIAE